MSDSYMARSSRKDTERHRQQVIDGAATLLRERGVDGVNVDFEMAEAGLTHGGFYAHFDSREGMLAEAADRAGADTVALMARVAGRAAPKRELEAMLGAYLSREHVEDTETGCAIAALGCEMPRQSPRVRRAATRRIKEMIDLIARLSPDWGKPGGHDRALVTLATALGAVVVARAVDDPKLADAVRQAALKHLTSTD